MSPTHIGFAIFGIGLLVLFIGVLPKIKQFHLEIHFSQNGEWLFYTSLIAMAYGVLGMLLANI